MTCEIAPKDIYAVFSQLEPEEKDIIMRWIIFDDLIEAVGKQLKAEDYDFCSWSTSWWVSGSELREAIMRFQGIEEAYRKDQENIKTNLTRERDHYKKWHDILWALYHDKKITYKQVHWLKEPEPVPF